MAVPAVRGLRETLPETRIALAGPWATVLADQALADTLVTYPRAWSARLAAADAMRALRPETVVVLPNSFESALAAWYWGGRRRVGFATGGRAILLTDAPALPAPRRHQIDEYLLLAEASGATIRERVPRLAPPKPDSAERAEIRALYAEAGAPRENGRRIVAVHLGAAYGPAKLWPLPQVEAFCRLMARDDIAVVLVGAPSDAAAATAVTAAAPARAACSAKPPA